MRMVVVVVVTMTRIAEMKTATVAGQSSSKPDRLDRVEARPRRRGGRPPSGFHRAAAGGRRWVVVGGRLPRGTAAAAGGRW